MCGRWRGPLTSAGEPATCRIADGSAPLDRPIPGALIPVS